MITTLTFIAILLTEVSHATLVLGGTGLHLSDETWVGNVQWEELKENAMRPEFEKDILFVSYEFYLTNSLFRGSCTSRIRKL